MKCAMCPAESQAMNYGFPMCTAHTVECHHMLEAVFGERTYTRSWEEACEAVRRWVVDQGKPELTAGAGR